MRDVCVCVLSVCVCGRCVCVVVVGVCVCVWSVCGVCVLVLGDCALGSVVFVWFPFQFVCLVVCCFCVHCVLFSVFLVEASVVRCCS